jgi:predicted secreted Zn-dependent protease
VHWDQVYRSLDLHERGHVAINVEAAKDLERALKAIEPQPTCEALLAEARRLAQLAWRAAARRQTEYDADTNHGQNQWTPYAD